MSKTARNREPVTAEHGQGQRRRTVLYVEDNLSNVELMEHILYLRPDVELLVTMQANLAFELARDNQPDLILLDLNLPDMSGEEVLAHLRADPRTATLPVVIVSADATDARIRRLLDSGAAGYLTKPFRVAELLEVVDRGRAAPATEAEPEAPTLDPVMLDELQTLDRELGPGTLARLINLFLEESRTQRLPALERALADKDSPALRRAAHSLKGSAGNYGARRLSAMCAQIEESATEGAWATAGRSVAALLSEFARVEDALRARSDGAPVAEQ